MPRRAVGRVSFVHRKVQGRVRLRISGLAGNAQLKELIEKSLKSRQGILSASCSLITGNALILFDPTLLYTEILRLLEDLLSEGAPSSANSEVENGGRVLEKGPALENTLVCTKRLAARLKEIAANLLPGTMEQEERDWHTLFAEDVLQLFNTGREKGLSQQTVDERLSRYGANRLPPSQARSRWRMFAHQFFSLPVGLLVAAAGISVFTGGILDAVIIIGVVVANAAVGFITENKAERTIESLARFFKPYAEVVREGKRFELPAEDLVVGDLIFLKQGSYVPADARLLDASNLCVDESALTGESMPVAKDCRGISKKETPLPERTNMVYMGTLVTGGQATAIVVATGLFTQIGRLQGLIDASSPPETPIERQLRQMGNHLVLVCLVVCGLVFIIGILRGYNLLDMLKLAVSLAASGVPEGLPAAATVNFALGMSRMRSHGVLVRRLQAVETLGAVQTLCLDKTGTITCNRMTVVECFAGMRHIRRPEEGSGWEKMASEILKIKEFMIMAEVSVLCNEARIESVNDAGKASVNGSPTETALLSFATSLGIDPQKARREKRLIRINHRSENRLFMTTIHRVPGVGRMVCVKGSPTEVLEMCTKHMVEGQERLLGEGERLRIESENDRMAADMLRVLGIAYRVDEDVGSEDESEFIWLGLIAMADPIREGVAEVIKMFHRAGIDTVMITGDQSATAYAVAKALDLSAGERIEILESSHLEMLDPVLVGALARKTHVYARVSPAHKLNVVKALQNAGKVVAMTGDGINDSPALKAADIGIAMGGSGTELAREVSDVVLEQDDLKSLVTALEDGRTIHANIKKSVHFFLSTNFSEIALMFGGMAAGFGTPLNVMQLLWINLISDILPGLALSMERPEDDVLARPPLDPHSALFSKEEYAAMGREAMVLAGSSLVGYTYGIGRYGIGPQAGAIAFQSLVIGQLLHALSCRSERSSFAYGVKGNPYLFLALGGSIALQVLTAVVPGLRGFLGMSSMSLLDAGVVCSAALAALTVNETFKTSRRGQR